MHDFTGKVVVIVSTSVASPDDSVQDITRRGHVGVICAQDFAAHGAHVVIIDPKQAELQALCAAISADGGRATPIVRDPGSYGELMSAAVECQRTIGGVDVLVTCHTDVEIGSIEDSSAESWVRVINFNLLGQVFAAKAFLPLLKQKPGSSIVHFHSLDGILGNPQIPSMSVSKGGVTPLTHLMAEEFAQYGIRVNAVARGMIIARGAPLHPMFEPLIEHTPLSRPAYPHEIAAAVRFLASHEASYITGVVLPVDGGRTGITPGTRPQSRS